MFDVPHFAWGSAEVGIIEDEVKPNDAEVEAYMFGEHLGKSVVKTLVENFR